MNILTFFYLFFFSFSFFISSTSRAEIAGNPDYWCRNGMFPTEKIEYKIGRILGNKDEKVFFYGEGDTRHPEVKCPNNLDVCRESKFLRAGNEVILAHSYGDFICVWYQASPNANEVVAWLPKAKIETINSPFPLLKDWAGHWKAGSSDLHIQISTDKKTLKISGNAYWPVKDIAPYNQGEFRGSAIPQNQKLQITDGVCKVDFYRIGIFLIGSDNHECGGANVNFDGVYIKR